MWRPVLLRKFYIRPPRSRSTLCVTNSTATCRLYCSGGQYVAKTSLVLCRNLGLRKAKLSFLSLVQPCCVRTYCSATGKDTDKDQEKAKTSKGKKKRTLSDDEFAVIQEMFKKKFNAINMQNIKDTQSKSFYHYTENNYTSIADAKEEYLLTDKDVQTLRTYRRSSPYDGEKETTGVDFIDVALTRDIVKVAVRKWGSLEAIEKEKRRRNYFYTSASPFRQVKQDTFSTTFKEAFGKENGLVVMMALIMNCVNAGCKLVILGMTGSGAVFSELTHSCADILNQIFLAFAKYKSLKRPDHLHPYGYGNVQPLMSIFCGVIFFSGGFGMSAYNAIQGFSNPSGIPDVSISTIVTLLSITFVTEAVSLGVACRQVRKDAKAQGISMLKYVTRAEDPIVNVVLFEDLAGVLGVLVCGGALGASMYFNLPVIDAIGSMTIGLMMLSLSVVLFKTSSDILLGKSLWYQDKVKQVIQNDRMVNAVFDNKTIDMGNQSRLKTEIFIDISEVTKHLLDNGDVDALLVEIQNVKTQEDMERFLQSYGFLLYDEIVRQIDRIERKVKAEFPEIRHIDMEPS